MSDQRKYAFITIQTRLHLINRVLNDGYSINSSAKLLKIRPSTAKAIVARYKKTGKVERKKKQMKSASSSARSEFEATNQIIQNEINNIPFLSYPTYQPIPMIPQYSYMNWMIPPQCCWNPQMMFY